MMGCPIWKSGKAKSLFLNELVLKRFSPSKGMDG
jgi:hypothetical protein